jgi:hypothetical protein
MIDAMVTHRDELLEHCEAWDLDVEILPTRMVTNVVGPRGLMPMGPPAFAPECPLADELLRRSPL